MRSIIDGNEAASYIAYKVNEVCAIYPITPASPMGEWVDLWAAEGKTNIWGVVPKVLEMQSEGGAAGAVHGSLQGGALTTTFTASQGLLLMIPNMFKIAGELNPTVFHIAARSIATHALSIFGDHSDVMATRTTGFAMLFASSVQEAMDMSLIAHSATLKSRIPFLHIFDGFRTSHELSKIEMISDEIISKMIPEDEIKKLRDRSLNPEHPKIRGTAQNPDVFFQAREAGNQFYNKLPGIVLDTMVAFEKLTGRKYRPFQYTGHPEAERVIILMGSGAGATEETVNYMVSKGEKVGFLNVHLFRPFDTKMFIETLPKSVRNIAVMDRTKEPGSIGDPLYQDVLSAYAEESPVAEIPEIIGGRYGLSSKEFTPAMVKGIFDELQKDKRKRHFTVGITDDVTHLSLDYDPEFSVEQDTFNSVFYGLGADGTVSANKNSIKIIGDTGDDYVQGYFVYDSKKAGALTISHLRFGKKAIHSTYLISKADFVACHQFNFLKKFDVLEKAKHGATFLLNAPFTAEHVWDELPEPIQREIIEKKLEFYVIDATKVAREAKLGSRINTILQTCFFHISGILPQEEAISRIKKAIEKSYAHKGEKVVQMNFDAVDKAISNLEKVNYPDTVTSDRALQEAVPVEAPDFVREVLGKILAGKGDELPVSSFPVDGTFPTATTQWEKRNIADLVPAWDEVLCTQCNKCVLICPHAAIRAKVYPIKELEKAPIDFLHYQPIGKDFDKETEAYSLQVAAEDCTGCNLCIEVCPAISKEDENYKAINMVERTSVLEKERKNWEFFLQLPDMDRSRMKITNVKGSQFMTPLFEFSGACAGCGETPYLKLITQLYGEHMIVANATGCSSIYGGNLPSTPWTVNKKGRGPAWSNSLFEDNAEFGLGLRMAANKKREKAFNLLSKLQSAIPDDLIWRIENTSEQDEVGLQVQQKNIEELRGVLKGIENPEAKELEQYADDLIKKFVWIIGGDGWAYDIGYGGLDHVISTGEDVNILVMDTEVYSNTGGQTSKATPIGASAKFSIAGKRIAKKDLALQAITYGNVYVAQVAMGAKDLHTIKAINEAANYPGPSLIIAYSHCIEHGIDMGHGADQQNLAVKSGYWPLFRYHPLAEKGKSFMLDSKEPSIPLTDYIYNESRYTRIIKQNKEMAHKLLEQAEEDVSNKWNRINAMMHL
ncbi:MAG: pyruvate:ferredoxin (flavodoxin) oxidoreductase [Vicingaceae bacterium]